MIAGVPLGRVESEKVATPPLRVPVPNIFVPCSKVMVSPLGGAPMLELTVAENCTVWPKLDCVGWEEVTTVVVAASTN